MSFSRSLPKLSPWTMTIFHVCFLSVPVVMHPMMSKFLSRKKSFLLLRIFHYSILTKSSVSSSCFDFLSSELDMLNEDKRMSCYLEHHAHHSYNWIIKPLAYKSYQLFCLKVSRFGQVMIQLYYIQSLLDQHKSVHKCEVKENVKQFLNELQMKL